MVLSESIGALYQHNIMNEPCGVKIVAFNEPSPAKDSGMQIGEIIYKINDIEISSLNNLKEHMDSYDPSQDFIINTKLNSYSIDPYFKYGKYILGVKLTQEIFKTILYVFIKNIIILNF